MISEIHQHPDGGTVYIRTDGGIYQDTTENFALDCQTVGISEPLPKLPEEATERIYQQGVRHPILDRENVIDGGPVPWPLGDEIISRVDDLLAAWQARQPPQITHHDTSATQIQAACYGAISGGFASSALGAPHQYPSSALDQAALVAAFVLAEPTAPLWCADKHGIWALRNHSATQVEQVVRDCRKMVLAAQQKHSDLLDKLDAGEEVAW